MPDTFFQTLAEELDSFDTVQQKWFDELEDPTKVARKCQQVVANKISASEMDCLIVVADKWIAELESNEQESREPTLKWVYEKEDSPYERFKQQYPIDLKALGKRFRLLLRLTQLSLRLLACDNKEAAEYMALKQGKELFPKLIQSSDQLRLTDSDQSDVAAIRVFDQWLQRASKKYDIDHSNSFARGVLAFLHPDLRSVRQKLIFEGLYYSPSADETGSETGYVVELTAEAIEDGTGGVYPNPENMTLAPLADSTDENRKFEKQVEFAWELAKKRTATNNACNIDVRWSLKLTDLPRVDDSYRLPYPITGNSWNSILTIVFEHLLCGNDLDRGWSLTAAVDDKGSLIPVDGVRAKARAWFSKQENRSSGYLLVTSKDLQDAKDGAGEVIAGDVNQRVHSVDTLDEIKNRLREWERENYGSVKFDRPKVREDFTGREDAIENLTHRLNDPESSGRVVVNGERGVGKSALLATMIDKAFNEGKRPVFCLAGHDKAGIEESLLVKLKRKYQYELSFREKALLTEVLDRVQEYLERENRNEVLYFDEDMCLNESTDGLDQLNDRPQIKELLPKLPSRFRYLLMTRNEGTRQSGSACQLSWEDLVGDSGRQDVTEYLRKHGRDKLSDHLIHQIDSEQNPVPNFEMIHWCLDHLKSEDKLSEHLRASPDMWLRKPIASSIPESLAIEFLKELSDKGLCNNVQFLPEHIENGHDIQEFCIRPRVVDADKLEQQRKRASEQEHSGFNQRSESDDRYVMMSEAFLRGHDEDRVVPHPLSPPTTATWHVLEGEPGEGKTTALWLMVARQCRELLERQQCGQPITEASGYRIPLVLPLRTVTTAQRSKRLIDLARDYVLEQMRFLQSEKQKRNQLQQWLDEKIACNEYTLYLDAWDELPDGKEGRRWLKEELLGCRKVPLLLTTRASLSNEARSLNPKPKRYRMVCFGNRQIRGYVDNFFKDREQGRELRERSRLSPGPSQLMRLPLLLGLMCMQKRDDPDKPLPRTRTELLKGGLYELFERGDERREIKNTRKRRDQEKEQILRHIAWRFHAAEPVPMSEDNLLDVLEQKLPLLTKECPEDEEALLKEFVDDGVLVPVGSDTYRFVLRSFHEYCLAGWIAQEVESPFVRAPDEPTFQRVMFGNAEAWDREDDWNDLTPLTEANWKHVWPLVAGQMGQKADWLFAVLLQRNEAETVLTRAFVLLHAEAISECLWRTHEVHAEAKLSRGQVGEFVRLFIQRLNHPDTAEDVREWSAEALGAIGDERCIEVLIERLNDPDTAVEVRNWSARALGAIGDERCIEVLIERLNDPDTAVEVRNGSALGLGAIGDERCIEVLIERLNDPDTAVEVRNGSALVLGAIGDERCIEVLIERLNDPDTAVEVRKWSAYGLGEIGDERCIEVLIERLNDPDTAVEVRNGSALGLGAIGDERCIEVLIERLNDPDTAEEVRKSSALALGAIGDERCIEVLIERLNDPDTAVEVRNGSALGLGAIGDERCIEVLIERLNDPDTAEEVRKSSALALGAIGDERCIEVLIERLNDPDTAEEVRNMTAEGLGNIGDERCIEVLIERLNDPDTAEEVRKSSALALGNIGDERCIEVLIERLNDPDTAVEVRKWSALVLGGIGDERFIEVLIERLNDPDTAVYIRVQTALALGLIGDERCFEVLIERLNDPDTAEDVRKSSAFALGNIGDERCIEVLIERLNDPDTAEEVRNMTAEGLGEIGDERCIEVLIERLNDPDTAEEVRKSSALALGAIGDERCIEALIERLNDPDTAVEVRNGSALGLGAIGDERCIEVLIERLNDPDTAVEVRNGSALGLGAIGDERCIEVLIERLNDPDTAVEVRKWSAYGLGEIGDERCIEVLIERLNDPDTAVDVRIQTAYGLGEIGDERCIEVLIERLNDPDTAVEVRNWSARALGAIGVGAIGGDRIAKSLREQLIDPDTPKTVQEAIIASLGIASA